MGLSDVCIAHDYVYCELETINTNGAVYLTQQWLTVEISCFAGVYTSPRNTVLGVLCCCGFFPSYLPSTRSQRICSS